MCLVKDPEASPRDIKSFNEDVVFVGGELSLRDNDWWIELVGKVASHELMFKAPR